MRIKRLRWCFFGTDICRRIQKQIRNKGNHEMSYVDLNGKTILVTGDAEFIGSNLVK